MRAPIRTNLFFAAKVGHAGAPCPSGLWVYIGAQRFPIHQIGRPCMDRGTASRQAMRLRRTGGDMAPEPVALAWVAGRFEPAYADNAIELLCREHPAGDSDANRLCVDLVRNHYKDRFGNQFVKDMFDERSLGREVEPLEPESLAAREAEVDAEVEAEYAAEAAEAQAEAA